MIFQRESFVTHSALWDLLKIEATTTFILNITRKAKKSRRRKFLIHGGSKDISKRLLGYILRKQVYLTK